MNILADEQKKIFESGISEKEKTRREEKFYDLYIGDKQVTQEEILKYIEDNPKTKVEFLPLEVSWESNEYPNEKG